MENIECDKLTVWMIRYAHTTESRYLPSYLQRILYALFYLYKSQSQRSPISTRIFLYKTKFDHYYYNVYESKNINAFTESLRVIGLCFDYRCWFVTNKNLNSDYFIHHVPYRDSTHTCKKYGKIAFSSYLFRGKQLLNFHENSTRFSNAFGLSSL